MKYMHLAAEIYNTPIMMEPNRLAVLVRIFEAYAQGNNAELEIDDPGVNVQRIAHFEASMRAGSAARTESGYYRTQDGIAIVQAVGEFVHRGNMMGSSSGLTSYDSLSNQLTQAVHDPLVRGILMEVDSCGGAAKGCFALADLIGSIGNVKPITAHINEHGMSAAYALAVSAQEVFAINTALIANVGISLKHVDQSAYDAKRGFKHTDIIAGAKKADGTPHAPLSDSARADMQSRVDRLYNKFAGHVATCMGIDEAVVRHTEAGVLHPDQALELGMIDGIGTIGEALESVRERAATGSKTSRLNQRATSSASQETFTMSNPNQPATQAAAVYTEAQIAEARAKAYADGEAAARKALADEAATAQRAATESAAKAERERVAGITTHEEAKSRQTLANHLAFNTTMSVDEAIALLKVSAKEQLEAANPLATMMANVPNPKIEPRANNSAEQDDAKAVIRSILTAGKSKTAA